MPKDTLHLKENHHQNLPPKNRKKRIRKKLGLATGLVLAVSLTLPESYFYYEGKLHKRIQTSDEMSSSNVAIVSLPAPEDADFIPLIFIPSNTQVVLVAA